MTNKYLMHDFWAPRIISVECGFPLHPRGQLSRGTSSWEDLCMQPGTFRASYLEGYNDSKAYQWKRTMSMKKEKSACRRERISRKRENGRQHHLALLPWQSMGSMNRKGNASKVSAEVKASALLLFLALKLAKPYFLIGKMLCGMVDVPQGTTMKGSGQTQLSKWSAQEHHQLGQPVKEKRQPQGKTKSRDYEWLCPPGRRQPRQSSRLEAKESSSLPFLWTWKAARAPSALLRGDRQEVSQGGAVSFPHWMLDETVETELQGKWAKFKAFLEVWGNREIQLQLVLFLPIALSRPAMKILNHCARGLALFVPRNLLCPPLHVLPRKASTCGCFGFVLTQQSSPQRKRQMSGTQFGVSQARPLHEAGAGIQSTAKTSQHLWSAIEHLRSVIQHLLEVPGLGSGMWLAYANDSL